MFEMGSLRNVPRAWQQILTAKVQNIAEHSWRTTLIAWILAAQEGADTDKVVKMCLIHDIAEARTGDIAFMHRNYVVRHEEMAEDHMLEDTAFEKEARALLKEYNERKTLEAKIVKDADNLDVDIELKEMAKIGDTSAIGMQKHHRPKIRAEKINTKSAKKMWDELQKTDANRWHRVLTGQWVKNKQSGK